MRRSNSVLWLALLSGLGYWLARSGGACELKIEFTDIPAYDEDHIAPASCSEHYDCGTYDAVPRYGTTQALGTSPGKFYFQTNYYKNGEERWISGCWAAFLKDCPQTEVTWNNGNKRTGRGGTVYTFKPPRTPIVYAVRFTTAYPQLLGKTIKGPHVSSAREGTGVRPRILT